MRIAMQSYRVPAAELLAPIRFGRPVALNETITLGASQMKQLGLREINVKEAFTLVDGAGDHLRASLQEGDTNSGRALVYEKMPGSTESRARITLVCAILARQRMQTVMQKATELGCVRIVPVFSDHAVKPTEIAKEQPAAWPTHAVRACRQCRRASVPEVLPPVPLASAVAARYWTDANERLWLDDRTAVTTDPFSAHEKRESGDYVVAVGPEGGWSDAERELLGKSAKAMPLGNRVLRAETAVFVGLAVVQHRLGDLR
jgi:16S rRNA (uracil1498-N3)-methyltransferase